MTSCGPCKEIESCEDIVEGEDEEYEALTELYNRLFDPPTAAACCPRKEDDDDDCDEKREGRCECPLMSPPPPRFVPPATVDYCPDRMLNESPVRRADRQLSALLKRRKGNVDEGDVKHLIAKEDGHKACVHHKPIMLNSAMFGLDLEHWMAAATGGDGRDDNARRAAYHLAAAEAYCKHSGAVEAAERAVHIEPAGHLAEVAARFGAQTYTKTHTDGDETGEDNRDESPVVVIAYVGNTGPTE